GIEAPVDADRILHRLAGRADARGRRDPRGRGDRDHDRAARHADRETGEDRRGRGRGRAAANGRAARRRANQRFWRAHPPFGARPPEGGGREMILALSSNGYWWVALAIGLVAALIV